MTHTHQSPPTLRLLSLGTGVQSTTLLLLAAHGVIARFDYALFAETGWEPARVYEHLHRLETLATQASIRLIRVSAGNIRADASGAAHKFASMPLFLRGSSGERGTVRRCTAECNIRPLTQQTRRLLGYPHPLPVPRGVHATQAIGISADEARRTKDTDVPYLKNIFPLLDLGWTRRDCAAYLAVHGRAHAPRSACIGCPFGSNRSRAQMRHTAPAEAKDAADVDAAVRHGNPAAAPTGMPHARTSYLHRDRIRLDQATLDVDTGLGPDGCSPWACRGDAAPGPAPGGEYR